MKNETLTTILTGAALGLGISVFVNRNKRSSIDSMSGYKRISRSDFTFQFAGHGHYKVTYTSPATGKEWTTVTTNMPLIDATKNADEPKQVDLIRLKDACKGGY